MSEWWRRSTGQLELEAQRGAACAPESGGKGGSGKPAAHARLGLASSRPTSDPAPRHGEKLRPPAAGEALGLCGLRPVTRSYARAAGGQGRRGAVVFVMLGARENSAGASGGRPRFGLPSSS